MITQDVCDTTGDTASICLVCTPCGELHSWSVCTLPHTMLHHHTLLLPCMHYHRPCYHWLQVKKLRLLLRARNLGAVRVGTVDDFQGQEARIIFISTVLSRPADSPLVTGRSKAGGVPTPAPHGVAEDPAVGFFRNPNRFNVAITRAQALMVVLGHPLVLMQVRAL